MKKLKILLLFLSVLVIVFSISYSYYNKKSKLEIKTAQSDVQISSEKLISSFLENEDAANSMFVEKIIEIEGVIKNITFINDRYSILLNGESNFSCVMCDMQPSQYSEIEPLKIGQPIVLKGVFKGFLMDAIFLDCIIIKSNGNE